MSRQVCVLCQTLVKALDLLMATGKLSFTDLQNPLFLHPSDGPTSIVVSKLQGSEDFRAWKRSFEIQLSAKRKLGFVDGSVSRSTTDAIEATQWDTCNNMVISWIHNNISDNIKSSVLFINTASEIWKQLEKRFSLTNGSRKYKLNKDLFSLKQSGMKVNEYFTCLSGLWEEIDSMNILPSVPTTTEVTNLLKAIETMKQEAKLFQFLNGLDDMYGAQRSQLLMMCPLPSVEMACSAVQQEESQREVLTHGTLVDADTMAMYSKGGMNKPQMCITCGRKGHTSEKCWETTGYPQWHYKHKPGQRQTPNKWSGNRKPVAPKVANNVQGGVNNQQAVTMTAQQLDKLLKLIPKAECSNAQGSETDEELDFGFSGMVCSNKEKVKESTEWIIDSGASDHMTSSLKYLMNVKAAPTMLTITLPTGATAVITHIGDVKLPNGLQLKNVLYVPQFKHNLLSIHKLAKDSKCDVVFQPDRCTITDSITKCVVGMGKMKQGLYYLQNEKEYRGKLAMTGQRTGEVQHNKGKGMKVKNEFNIWHQRLGHASISKMQHIEQVKHCLYQQKHQVCITCPMAKMTRLTFPISSSHASEIFHLVHTDIWGPYKVNTRGKFRFFLTLVDDCSRVTWVYLLEKKSDYLSTLMKFEEYVSTQYKGKMRIIRSDNALEFADRACTEYFAKKGIIHQTTCPYTPQQNARAERKHRHVLEVARALRFQSGVPLCYWGDCVLTAVYIINRLPSAALNFEVPYERLTGEQVDYDSLKVFGCMAMAYNAARGGDKFAPRSVPCVFLGYPSGTKGYRLLNLKTMQIFNSRHVTFHEEIFPLNEDAVKSYAQPLPTLMPQSRNTLYEEELEMDTNNEVDRTEDDVHETEAEVNQSPLNNDSNEESGRQQLLRKSTRTSKQPDWLKDFVTPTSKTAMSAATITPQLVSSHFNCFLATIVPQTDPTFFHQAVKLPHWVEAMNAELQALEENKTWEVTTLPTNRKAIGCKWIYKTKFKADGSIDKHKARLVILGYKQTYGIDYVETFAPVAKMTTVRALLAVAAMKEWHVHQLDVSNAFLNGELEETVYMMMPQGYNGYGSRISESLTTAESKNVQQLVCRLKKALYGLRQASRQWHHKLSVTLVSIGFSHSKSDYSLYSKVKDEVITLVLIYVDDILISGNCGKSIDKLKAELSAHFHMKDLGPVSYFLGLEIDRSNAGFFVSQRKYTLDLIKEFGMMKATPLKLPMDTHLHLTPDKGELLNDPQPYQRLLGKLIYLTITRPDLSFPVHTLAQYMQRPTSVHMQAAKRILRYLLINPAQGILLASSSAAQLTAYCDSDWASCPTTRKSTSGYCVLLGSSPISWKTKKQSVVARSTAEAEYRAMALTCCEVTWISALLKDMGLQDLPPTIIKSDNQAALSIAANPVLHERTKHIEIDCHFIRDKIVEGAVVTTHVPSHSQLADVLTKPIPVKQHNHLLRKIGVSAATSTPLEGE